MLLSVSQYDIPKELLWQDTHLARIRPHLTSSMKRGKERREERKGLGRRQEDKVVKGDPKIW